MKGWRMNCEVGEATEGLENELWRRKGWRMSFDVGEVTKRLENEQSSLHLRHNSFSKPSVALPTSQLILQPFSCFTYVTTHSPTLL